MPVQTFPPSDRPDCLTSEWVGSPSGLTLPDGAMLSPKWVMPVEIRLSEARIRVEFTGQPPTWFPEVAGRLEDLSRLRADWDSYGARPIRTSVVVDVLRFLADFLPASGTTPQLVPTPAGGIQIEWHRADLDVEIEFPPDDPAEFSIEGLRGEAIEGELRGHPAIPKALARL